MTIRTPPAFPMSTSERAAWPLLLATLRLYVDSLGPLTPERAYQVLCHQDDDAPRQLLQFSPRHVRAAMRELERDGAVQRVQAGEAVGYVLAAERST